MFCYKEMQAVLRRNLSFVSMKEIKVNTSDDSDNSDDIVHVSSYIKLCTGGEIKKNCGTGP